MSDSNENKEFSPMDAAYKHINDRFIDHMRKLLEEEFGKDRVPFIIPMMSTETYIRSSAAGMTLGYLEAVKDSMQTTASSGVWCVVAYDYYAHIYGTYPNRAAAIANRRKYDVGLLPYGESANYFGCEDNKKNLEVL